jgi:hypothetical protein
MKGVVTMNPYITPQQIYQSVMDLPGERLQEVWQFIEFVKFKEEHRVPKKIVKLGGLLREHHLNITEDDIAQARKEMWGNVGEIVE